MDWGLKEREVDERKVFISWPMGEVRLGKVVH